MDVYLIPAIIIIAVTILSFMCKENERLKEQQKRLRQKQLNTEKKLSQYQSKYSALEKRFARAEQERTATEAEMSVLLDTQVQLKLEALEAGNRMLRESVRSRTTSPTNFDGTWR